MIRTTLLLTLASLLLGGCLSISTSEAPVPEVANACHGREQQCREICGSAGVRAFTCNAKPGEGFEYRCECRMPGSPI